MAQLTDRVLQYLNQTDSVDTEKIAEEFKEDHQKIIGAIKSLQSLGDIIEAEQLTRTKTELTAEGKSFVESGSHEALVYAAVPEGEAGIPQPDLMKATGSAGKIGMSKAIQNGWIKMQKEGGVSKVVRQVDSIEDIVRDRLKAIQDGAASSLDNNALAELKKRKLLTQTPVNYYHIKRGRGFTVQVVKLETELTPEMLASGEWKQKKFKPYNFQALGVPVNAGHLHPLLKVRSEFRSILLEMGFSEMPTNRFVESSFWNFDALYVPQKHPARDAQDTFFMSQPDKCTSIPEEFMKKVRAAHTGTDYDTLGYGPTWKVEEAYKNCMRTHTTAVSARMLHAIGSKPEFQPSKLFSIDRVYRNETLDATHLAEFHQVEGVVADYNLNLGNLIGVMKEFFNRLGITKLRFKPAYNPYTEPSMEVFSYHEGLKKWVEVGNSGMFRPEMLLPMGLPKDVRIIAWGLSLERPTMIRYGIDNIRDLVGPKVDLQMVYDSPICRLDKNFKIGTDGSYLDNPLLKSPRRKKNIVASIPASPLQSEPLGDQQQPTTKKNKKKKKKNKNTGGNNTENTSVGVSNIDASPCESAGAAGPGVTKSNQQKDKNRSPQQPSSSKQSQSCSSKENVKVGNTSKKSGKGGGSGDDFKSEEEKVAERLKAISDHLKSIAIETALESQVTAAATATATASTSSSKPSKKKKKSKVKSAEPASSQNKP